MSRFVLLSFPDLLECLPRSPVSLAVGSRVRLPRRFRFVLLRLASCLVCPLWVCRPCKGRIKLPSLPRCIWLPCCHFGAYCLPSFNPHPLPCCLSPWRCFRFPRPSASRPPASPTLGGVGVPSVGSFICLLYYYIYETISSIF